MLNSYSSDIINYFINNEDISSVAMTFEHSKEGLECLNNTIKPLSSKGVYLQILDFGLSQIQVEFFKTNETDNYIEMVNKWNEIGTTPLFNYQWNSED